MVGHVWWMQWPAFRLMHNSDQMAVEKLSEGIAASCSVLLFLNDETLDSVQAQSLHILRSLQLASVAL